MELEIEKKSLLMDHGARTGSTLSVLKQSIAALKAQSDSQKTQIVYVRQKISELKSVDRPFMKEAAPLATINASLKKDLADLAAQRQDLMAQIDAAVQKKLQTGLPSDVRRFGELSTQKAALEARIADAQAKKDRLAADSKEHVRKGADLASQIKSLEIENKALEESMGNVRENIAVLEYRINTVTRYKNRNSTKN